MARLDGFGEKSATNIMRSIEKSRNVDAIRLLYALTIPMCGIDVCKRLLSAYPLNDLISSAIEAQQSDYFAHIPGIGPEKSASFINWFQQTRNQEIVQRLLQELNVSQISSQPQGKKCEGMTFVITGDVHHYKNRNELKAYIESQGGKVAGSVSGSTNYLINNDITSTSGKNKKAKELGIEIISEDTFIERFGNNVNKEQIIEGSLF
jgi:DNA ligase (NAD+)